jgi:hypothetical protein
MKQQKQRGYYVAVFGDQIGPPAKDSVDSGRYIPYESWSNYEDIQECDLILLYCTGSYIGYDKEAPGVGVVRRVEPPAIHYCYLPLDKPVTLDELRSSFSSSDKNKLDNLRFNKFRIFCISGAFFKQSINKRCVDWSKM